MTKQTWAYYDFFHHPYKPLFLPRHKFSSDVLLHNSLMLCDDHGCFLALVDKIRSAVGPWNTVWGVKLNQGEISWELYFYNRQFSNWPLTVKGLLKALQSYFKIPAFVKKSIECEPYFMFSIDLNKDIFKSKRIEGVHLYTEDPTGAVDGNCHYWAGERTYLENSYHLFRMPRRTKQFINQVKDVSEKYYIPLLKHHLVRKLLACHQTGVARKKDKNGIYFSRVDIDQLLYFLEYFTYPDHILDFIRLHKDKLDHLLYDVAFDCTLSSKGIAYGKSSYYSVF